MNSADIVLALIKSVITDTPASSVLDAETIDYASIFHMAETHDMTALVSQGLYQNGVFPQGEWGESFKTAQIHALSRCARLDGERALVCRALSDANIPYVVLKGSVLKDFYPESYMRTQGDVDILVKADMFSAAESILVQQLGFFKQPINTRHDVSFYTPRGVHIELHYVLLEEIDQSADELLSTVWSHVSFKEDAPCHGLLKTEFFMFYHLVHMAKHFLRGGCGIRTVVDLWIIRKHMQYDNEVLEEMLAACGLTTFYQAAMHLADVWFGSASYTELTKDMADYILEAGVYGSVDNRTAIHQARNGGKLVSFLKKVFMDLETMKICHPAVAKRPYLYPFYQIKRWVRLVFRGGKQKIQEEIAQNQRLTDEKRQKVVQLCNKLKI